jgi:hypothetical protein
MPKEITVSKPWLATRDTGTRIRVSVWYMVFSSQEWLEFSLASNSSQGSFQFCCWDKCSSGRQVWSRKTAQPFIHTYDTKQAQSRLQGVELRSGLLFVFLRGMDGLDLRTYCTCTCRERRICGMIKKLLRSWRAKQTLQWGLRESRFRSRPASLSYLLYSTYSRVLDRGSIIQCPYICAATFRWTTPKERVEFPFVSQTLWLTITDPTAYKGRTRCQQCGRTQEPCRGRLRLLFFLATDRLLACSSTYVQNDTGEDLKETMNEWRKKEAKKRIREPCGLQSSPLEQFDVHTANRIRETFSAVTVPFPFSLAGGLIKFLFFFSFSCCCIWKVITGHWLKNWSSLKRTGG